MSHTLLPSRCFISHAYADASVRDDLIRKLGDRVVPIVFPPITVKPEEYVSDHLIQALLECDGLIYLEGGQSAQSFWVALERDYALRAGKPVFSADPVTLDVTKDIAAPLDLAAFASYVRADAPRVREIANYMKRDRFFDIWVDIEEIRPGQDFKKEITESLADRLKRGGYAVIFWSQKANDSRWITEEIRMAVQGTANIADRVLFALLEDCPLPENLSTSDAATVKLYADTERSVTQRLDDLVVRLYWLIYKNTRIDERA